MHITTTFTSDRALVMRSYRACHGRSVLARWVVSGCFTVVGLLTHSVFLTLFGILLFMFCEVAVRRQLMQFRDGPRLVTVSIDDTGYTVTTCDRSTSRAWSTFRKIERVRGFWVLRQGGSAALALPVSALDAEQTEELTAGLREIGLMRTG